MNKPIRVLHVIGIMNQGGAETMIMNIYRKIDRDKVQFDFVENENDGAFFDEEIRKLGGRIYHCPRFTGKNFLKYRKWWKEFFKENNDYSFVHGHIGSTAAIYLSEAKKHSIKTIAHSHNIDAKGRKQFIYNVFSHPVRKIADYFFMCSIQAGKDRFGKNVTDDPNKSFLVPNAIDTEQFRFNEKIRANKRNELGIAEKELLVGHVGRFADQKNHSFLLNIFKEATIIDPSSKLLLVGDGDLRQTIIEKIHDLDLDDKVIMAGTREDVNELMTAMDVLLFPSKYEGLPVTLVEAQCSGLPCVISDNIPEDSILIKDSVTVLSLSESSSVWAKQVLQSKPFIRSESADQIKGTEFDVDKSTKWLEEFYLGKTK